MSKAADFAAQVPALEPLLELIRAVESGKDGYIAANRGKAGDTPGGWPGLDVMTLGEVIEAQRRGELSAAGAYQFMPVTLQEGRAALKLSDGRVFDRATQDELAAELILGGKRPRLRDFINGKAPDTQEALDEAQSDLAHEWAAIPLPSGAGAYDGDKAGNRASAKVAAVRQAIRECRDRMSQQAAPASPEEKPAVKPAAKPSPVAAAGMIGPRKHPRDFGLQKGDSHLIVNDRLETCRAFSFEGQELWEVPALARGQGSDYEFKAVGTDTPPGLYQIGTIYADYERVGKAPAYSRELMQYGWFSFDLLDLEGQEGGIGRAGIMIHGGGSACGWPGAWAPRQPLHSTFGCVRMHNLDLRDRLLPLARSGRVFVSVLQERP